MRSDGDINMQVKGVLVEFLEDSAAQIGVDTRKGRVFLDGVVDTLGDKEKAEELALEVPGVKEVANRLSIGMERQVKDDELMVAVENKLMSRDKGYRKIGVAAKKGKVHLYGDVENLAEEKDILSTAIDVQGVREVVSHLKIEDIRGDGLQIDDITVHNNIVQKLSTSAEVDAVPVDVKVKKGKVTLTGSVGSKQSKKLAGQLAAQADGVKDVINKLTAHKGGAGGKEELEATLRHELGKDDRVSPTQVKVYVEGNTVYLDGTVDSPDTKAAAFEVINLVLLHWGQGKYQIRDNVRISGAKGSINESRREVELIRR